MFNEKLKAKGRVHLLLTDKNGRTKYEDEYDNLVTLNGRAYIIDQMHEWTYTTSSVASSVLTMAANHGFHNGDEIIFTALGGNTGLTATNTVYWVIAATATTFQVSATEGGAAVTITGSANMTFRHRANNVVGMGLGTGSTAAAAADTVLGTEIGSRKTGGSLTVSKVGTTGQEDSIRFVANWAAGESTNVSPGIREAGLFNHTATTGGATTGGGLTYTGGILIARTVFGQSIPKDTNDSLQVTWTITMTASGS
jgi:hypothetical protein